MSVRLILLAPGDLIASVKTELSARHIDYKYDGIDNDTDHPRSAAESREAGGRDRELLREHTSSERRAGGGDSGRGSDRPPDGTRRTNEPGVGGRSDEGDASTDNSRDRDPSAGKKTSHASQSGAHPSGDQMATKNVDSAVDMASEVGQDGGRRVFALTESIVGALRERGALHVQLPGDCEPREGDVCYHIGAAALKTLGLPSSETLAQKDAEAHWRRQLGKRLAITKVHSPAMLEKLFPTAAPDRRHRTSVALVTNLERYVPSAHVIFTAPSGDSSWKKLAREATKRANIRAYAHDPSAGPAGEALLALIDAL
uniref:Helicase n=1 Tax=Wad Medani virus TaxID=40067 RepID=A0A7S6A9B5_9REOV|nr:helicase [Wad Medani virus]